MTKDGQDNWCPGQDNESTYRQIIQLLSGVVYSVFAYKTHQIVLIWQMGLQHCLSMSSGVPKMVQNDCSAVRSGSYSNSFVYASVFNLTHAKKRSYFELFANA